MNSTLTTKTAGDLAVGDVLVNVGTVAWGPNPAGVFVRCGIDRIVWDTVTGRGEVKRTVRTWHCSDEVVVAS